MEVAVAFLVDQALGDPPRLPHPVVLLGRFIALLDRRLYRPSMTPRRLLFSGGVLVLVVLSTTLAIALLLLAAAARLHPILGKGLAIWLLSTTFAAHGLAEAARDVVQPLAAGDLEAARQNVARIVGRDTAAMTEAEVARAAVETVAENTVDGVTAPLFYALLGGVPLALLYKAVNTMDSMLGYTDRRYLYFGRAAARLDDLANWLPARLTVPVMLLAAAVLRLDVRRALSTVRRDGRRHPSPNSGLAEALVAGALGVTLGGVNSYGGRISERPLLGAGGMEAMAEHVRQAVKLMRLTSLFFLMCGLALKAAVLYLAGRG